MVSVIAVRSNEWKVTVVNDLGCCRTICYWTKSLCRYNTVLEWIKECMDLVFLEFRTSFKLEVWSVMKLMQYKSFVNGRRPNIDPCGKPLTTIWGLDLKPLATVWLYQKDKIWNRCKQNTKTDGKQLFQQNYKDQHNQKIWTILQ